MKKIFALLSLFVFCVSCSLDDNDYPNYDIVSVPIESVEVPGFFVQGGIHKIKLFYNRPSTCHFPNGIYYLTEPNNTRIIILQNVVYHRDDCTAIIDEEDLVQEMNFDFQVTQPIGSVYTFKFYQGVDQGGEDSFLIIEVPVKEQSEETP